jgi:hypothetical protein
VSLIHDYPHVIVPPDGRQSARAATIQRGVGRLLRTYGFAVVTELGLANGRRADVVGLNREGEFWIVEIKSSVEDFRVDRKWPEYRMACDRLFFATHAEVPPAIFPADTGLVIADSFGGEFLRHAPEHRLTSARRRLMLVRFAQAAALKLHDLADPGAAGDLFSFA